MHYRLAYGSSRPDRKAADDHWWAVDAVDDLVRAGGRAAVTTIVALADAVADDEPALAYLGAGAVEDLLRHRGPPSEDTVEAMDAAARQNRSVRFAVRCVWWGDDDDPALVARFRRFGDNP